MFRKLSLFLFSSMFLSACAQGAESDGGLPWWGWLLILLILALIAWLLFRKRPEEEIKPEVRSMAVEVPQADEPAEPEPMVEDDLKIIEGIGPKIESVLKAAGVHSFSQLARMDAASIGGILSEGGIRLAFPESWPEQARLAAVGEMAELKALQDKLQAGR